MWLFLVGPLPAEMPWFAGAHRNRDGQPWIELMSPRSRTRARAPDGFLPFLEDVARGSLEGTPLRGLDDTHRAWRAAGAELARVSRVRGSEEHVLAILRTLPSELQRSLDVPSPDVIP
jgi:hypothetical protein